MAAHESKMAAHKRSSTGSRKRSGENIHSENIPADHRLPVNINNSELEKYPEFAKLLGKLTCHISPEGCNTLLMKELTETQSALNHEKLKWLQYHILYTELQELLVDHQLKISQSTPSSNTEFYKAVSESLTYAEIGNYVSCHPDPSSEVTLLGLGKNDVHKKNPHFKHVATIQQKLIPEVEFRLRKKCESLVNFHECSSNIKTDSNKLTFAKSSQLPTLLESEKRQLAEEQKFLKKEKQERERQFWQYYQALLDSLNILESLITKHRLQTQSQSDSTTTQWLTARCDAMCLKIKMFEVQLMCDTYYAETVKALTKTRNHLDVAILETQHELSTIGHALKAYEAVGSGFDDLVREFTDVKEELENKIWAMRELRQSSDKE